jgi:hypothetical protein
MDDEPKMYIYIYRYLGGYRERGRGVQSVERKGRGVMF